MTLSTCCAPVLAAKQDNYVHIEDVQPGEHKAIALSTFGPPIQNYVNHKGESCDIFKFRQGYRNSTKVARAVLHGTADFLTLGLWEIIGTPVEAGLNGENVSYEVCLILFISELPLKTEHWSSCPPASNLFTDELFKDEGKPFFVTPTRYPHKKVGTLSYSVRRRIAATFVRNRLSQDHPQSGWLDWPYKGLILTRALRRRLEHIQPVPFLSSGFKPPCLFTRS